MNVLKEILKHAETVLRTAPCTKYNEIDRHGILDYHNCSSTQPLPDLVQFALRTHILARQSAPTRLKTSVHVFCPDTLENIVCINSIDLAASLRGKLGKTIDTYEELVTWYLSLSNG